MRCIVYKSLRQFDYYLFLDQDEGLSRVPEGLKRLLGKLEKIVEIELHPQRALAQADVAEVMQQLSEQGYYLQMPPGRSAESPVA